MSVKSPIFPTVAMILHISEFVHRWQNHLKSPKKYFFFLHFLIKIDINQLISSLNSFDVFPGHNENLNLVQVQFPEPFLTYFFAQRVDCNVSCIKYYFLT